MLADLGASVTKIDRPGTGGDAPGSYGGPQARVSSPEVDLLSSLLAALVNQPAAHWVRARHPIGLSLAPASYRSAPPVLAPPTSPARS